MAIVEAKTAIRNLLASITPKLPTAFEGTSFDPPESMYQRLQFVISPPTDPTTGKYFYRENITVQIFVADKLDNGTDPTDSRTEYLRSYFDKGLTLTFDNFRMHVLRTPQIISATIAADRVVGAVFIPLTVEVYRD